jgi:hypothetical protein
MRRLMLVLAVAAALAFSASASAAAVTYISWPSWSPGMGYGSSYSSSWVANGFYKSPAFDSTVTFIDNVTYSWHATFRSSGGWTYTQWFTSQVKKAYCVANAKGGYGACTVYS